KFAASDTKRHAEEIARWCESRVELDGPVNIHLTGCHHSCAQHYIGDIGLLACKVQTSEDGDAVEGYHVHVGGGFGPDAAIAPEIYRDVKAEEAPRLVERMLKAYLAHRASPQESFLAFTRRHEIAALPLVDRRKLAEGRPLPRRLMAAMGQQDCGQCGYNCQDYSDAIFRKEEERLNLCVPGGKDTARMLKALHAELGRAPAAESRT